MLSFKTMLTEGRKTKFDPDAGYNLMSIKHWSKPEDMPDNVYLGRLAEPNPTSDDPEHAAVQAELHGHINKAYNTGIRVYGQKMSERVKKIGHAIVNGAPSSAIDRMYPSDEEGRYTAPSVHATKVRNFIDQAQEGSEKKIQIGPLKDSVKPSARDRIIFPDGSTMLNHLRTNLSDEELDSGSARDIWNKHIAKHAGGAVYDSLPPKHLTLVGRSNHKNTLAASISALRKQKRAAALNSDSDQ